MLKKRLIRLVPQAMRFIAANVLLQWIGLVSSVVMIITIAQTLNALASGTGMPLVRNIFVILTMIVIRCLCIKLAASASYAASKDVKHTIRELITRKVLTLGPAYSESVPTAELVQLAGEGAEQLETYFGNYLPQFFYAMLAPLTLFAVFGSISMKVAVTLLICIPLIPVSIVIVQKIAKRLLKDYWGQYAALGDHFLENLQGLTTLKIYQADEARHQEMNKEAEHFRRITMKVLSMQLNSIIVMDLIAYGGAALGILLALVEYTAGRIGLDVCLIIILLSADFFLPMRQLGSFFHVAMNGMAASDKIFRLLDIPVVDGGHAIPDGNAISIRDLRFGYPDAQETLHGLSMDMPENSFTALVGPSGCGKSTLAALLIRKNKGYTGSVRLGGRELSGIDPDELMHRVAYISHNSYLFKGSVRENLLMGKADATDEMLWQVLEQVRLADYLRQEGGLTLVLSEGGSNLSGGQRQRLALARALLYDPPVLVFDEATSNIDVESENDIMALIRSLTHQKTILLISHRLANAMTADQIIVMEKGRIVERGTHDELLVLSQQGFYHKLWSEQQALEHMVKEAEQ